MPRWRNWQIHPVTCAPLAELADAHASGACIRKDVEVRILWGAHVTGRTGGRCEQNKIIRVQLPSSALLRGAI